jgi:hypothetical protein
MYVYVCNVLPVCTAGSTHVDPRSMCVRIVHCVQLYSCNTGVIYYIHIYESFVLRTTYIIHVCLAVCAHVCIPVICSMCVHDICGTCHVYPGRTCIVVVLFSRHTYIHTF